MDTPIMPPGTRPGQSSRNYRNRVQARSAVYDNMRVELRLKTPDELSWARDLVLGEINTVGLRWEDIADDATRANTVAVDRFQCAERLRAVEDEIALRQRAARLAAGRPTAADTDWAQWGELARIVREHADIRWPLEAGGWPHHRVGRDPRGTGDEYAGPCPMCRDGVDRLKVWTGPPGRVWCRQCKWKADIIGVTVCLAPGVDSFREAVAWLADAIKIEVPS